MLIHHFGSREGLLTEVVRKVEADQRLFLESLQLEPEQTVDEMWRRLSDPRLWAAERLFSSATHERPEARRRSRRCCQGSSTIGSMRPSDSASCGPATSEPDEPAPGPVSPCSAAYCWTW